MAWTATILPGVERTDGNIAVKVQFTDGTSTFVRDFTSSTITPTEAKQRIHAIVEGLNARDARFAAIKALEGQAVPPEAQPAPDANLVTFRKRWERLMKLKKLGSVDAAIVATQATLQGQVEAYIKANPTAIDDDRIG